MSFDFSRRSLDNLIGVHEDLVNVATRAIYITAIDFAVVDGLRTAAEQEAAFLSGASQRRTGGKHQIGHAIDVMACIGDADHDGDKDENWAPEHYPIIARAFQVASRELSVPVVWGLVWDKPLASLADDLMAEVAAYDRRLHRKGYRDWGHFELRLSTGFETA